MGISKQGRNTPPSQEAIALQLVEERLKGMTHLPGEVKETFHGHWITLDVFIPDSEVYARLNDLYLDECQRKELL